MKGKAMLEEQIRKIIELRHDAPYAILGPHSVAAEGALTIRALLPQAERAYVLPADGSSRREMQRLYPDGLFAIRIPGVMKLDYDNMRVAALIDELIRTDMPPVIAPGLRCRGGIVCSSRPGR